MLRVVTPSVAMLNVAAPKFFFYLCPRRIKSEGGAKKSLTSVRIYNRIVLPRKTSYILGQGTLAEGEGSLQLTSLY
jgi:hypothetical protein